MTVNQAERAFRAWPILTKRAGAGKTITYGELGALLGVHHRAVRYVLALIQDYCLGEKLPPLTILIVNQGGKPGTGFIAYDVDKLEEGETLVRFYNWNAIPNPFTFASDGTTYEEIVSELAGNPSGAADVMRMVKTRGIAQSLFRDALLKAYQYRCAFTNISFQPVLEACHIVPWSICKPEERLDIRNGLLLNSVHHKLFDEGLVTVTKDFRIWYVDPDLKNGPYSKYDLLLSANLHGQAMKMPIASTMWPTPTYLERSHKLYEWQQHLPT
ncbi:MAG: HNH endonuclease [Desulfobulbus sp.]|nr:HNH endonuclease [Desulfobulbus sp.]